MNFITEEVSRNNIVRLAALRDSRHFRLFFQLNW